MEEKCPSCGAANGSVRRTVEGEPHTIEELKQWYKDRGLPPYETTRFFIGIDYKQPKAFGIYFDESKKIYIVYKNKADGSRAVRYQGTDEAYAVNELLMRLKQEILQQKARSSNVSATKGNGRNIPSKIFAAFISFILINVVIAVILPIFVLFFIPRIKTGYYLVNNEYYYHYNSSADSGWYRYDKSSEDWHPASHSTLPAELRNNETAENYYYQSTWDPATQTTDFTTSDAYKNETARRDNDDSDYDWDSGSDWDSGGTDWDSDW